MCVLTRYNSKAVYDPLSLVNRSTCWIECGNWLEAVRSVVPGCRSDSTHEAWEGSALGLQRALAGTYANSVC